MESLRVGYQTAIKAQDFSYRKFFRATERSQVFWLTDCLAKQLSNERVFLIMKMGKDCGAVGLNMSALLNHAASIIRLDGDSLSALSEDHTQGILVDQNLGDPEQAYEVVVWGGRWSLLALACDQGYLL